VSHTLSFLLSSPLPSSRINQANVLQLKRSFFIFIFSLIVWQSFRMVNPKLEYNIIGNKINNETQKRIIRNNFPPQIAERMCSAIDGQENMDHFMRLLNEYNEWMVQQQRQQEAVIEFLRQYRSRIGQ
jgi:hypothetical protein